MQNVQRSLTGTVGSHPIINISETKTSGSHGDNPYIKAQEHYSYSHLSLPTHQHCPYTKVECTGECDQ